MRTTETTIFRDSLSSIERASERLLDYQRQVASGRRITRPSDDPVGAAAAIGERSELAAIEQYTRTGDSAMARLRVADTALSDVIDRLTQAQTAIVGAMGTQKSDVEREAAAQTLEGIRQSVLSDLNASFQGVYLFAGANSIAAPFTTGPGGVVSAYQGSTQEVMVDIDGNRAVTIGIDGSAISQGGAAASVFAALDAAAAAARAGDHAGLQQALADLGAAFDRTTAAQTRVGTTLAAIDAQQATFVDRRLAGQARVSKLEDANMAEAITGMNQADAGYRAALGATSQIARRSLMDYLS
jgi:flagellar hook-associated protein 3 FlgL